MPRFSDDQIEEVRSRADIVEVIGAHVRLRRAGRNFVGLCPFHNEKTPSFSVNPERGFFHCFGCGAGGTVFNFMMRLEGAAFPEVVSTLARRYGVTLPELDAPGAGSNSGERETLFRANQTAADFFAHVLWNTPDGEPARAYLKTRGVSVEIAREFMLGFAPDRVASLARALEKRALTAAALKLGLVKRDANGTHDMFRARLMFPIRDGQGRVIAFGGRVLGDRLPKYINSPESPLYSKGRNVYGLYEARKAIARADRVIVVEGYLDAIALAVAGFAEVVASLGTALTADQLRLVGRLSANILACFDGDAAGRKASMRAVEIFLSAGMLGRAILIPPGFDPDTFVKQHGAAAFEALAASARMLFDYFLDAQSALAAKSLGDRSRAAERVAEMLRMVSNPFEFDLLARRAAEAIGVSEDVLRRYVRRPAPRRAGSETASSAAPPPRIAARIGDAGDTAEAGLVAIAILRPEMRAELLTCVDLFENEALLHALLEACSIEGPNAAAETALVERMTDEDRARVGALAVGGAAGLTLDTLEEARALAADFVAALSRRRRRRETEVQRREAAAAGARGSVDDAAAAAQALIALRRGGG